MSAAATCPRCHGPATIVDKAPPGESGDVIRCDYEKTCAALTEAARFLEETHADVVPAAQEFVRAMGKPKRTAEIKVPGHLYAELAGTVEYWKKAGEALVRAQRKHAAAQRAGAK